VVAAQHLVALRPIEKERASADARRFGLDQPKHHLHRDRCVERRAAALEHCVARVHCERMRRRDDEPRAGLLSLEVRTGRNPEDEDGREDRSETMQSRLHQPCGLSTTLPKISRSSMRRNASLTCESGNSLSMMGLSLPWRMRSMSATRSSGMKLFDPSTWISNDQT